MKEDLPLLICEKFTKEEEQQTEDLPFLVCEKATKEEEQQTEDKVTKDEEQQTEDSAASSPDSPAASSSSGLLKLQEAMEDEESCKAIMDATKALDSALHDLKEARTLVARVLAEKQLLEDAIDRSSTRHKEVGQFLAELAKELSGSCIDPISLQPMKEPVLAADLHTYDRRSIEDWHRVNPTSPHTRAPMEISTLRSNRAVLWIAEAHAKVAEAISKFWPNEALVASGPARQMPPVLVKDELLKAIMARDEDLALELLARPMANMPLNSAIKMKSGDVWSTLQLALVRQLPRTARAIAARPDFRRNQFLSRGIHAIHIAAALGYEDVCRAILEDSYDPELLSKTTQRQISIPMATGGTLTVPASATSWHLARSFKHDALLDVFDQFSEGRFFK